MTAFQFTKMHGLGNDFVVIETITQNISLNDEIIREMADRRLGIGCDQVLVLSPPSHSDADFNYRIYNADGSEAEHCGNGARCLAKFIYENKLSDKLKITLQLPTHIIKAEIISEHVFKIDMGQPEFGKGFNYKEWVIIPVSLGNPHAIIFADKPCLNLAELGRDLNHEHHFPEGVNVSWAIIRDPQHIDLNVYERGAGLTPACGSAASACVAAAVHHKLCDDTVVVTMPGGDCTVEWPRHTHIYLSGPAVTIYSGIWHG